MLSFSFLTKKNVSFTVTFGFVRKLLQLQWGKWTRELSWTVVARNRRIWWLHWVGCELAFEEEEEQIWLSRFFSGRKTSEIGMFSVWSNTKAFTIRIERIKGMIEGVYWVSVALEIRHFDTKSFRYKSTRYKLKSFRDIIKVDSIHVESRFDSTQPLCNELGNKVSIIRKWFEPRSNIPWLKKIIWVTGVLRRTVVSDWRFDNLCGSHLQSQVVVLVENSKTLVSDLIGQ